MQSYASPDRSSAVSRHRRQVFWQILFPVILAAIGAITLIVLVSIDAGRGSSAAAEWANISLVGLILPLLLVGILLVIPLAGIIFLISRLQGKITIWTHLVDVYIRLFSVRLSTFLYRITQPQIDLLSRLAGLKALWKLIWRPGKHGL